MKILTKKEVATFLRVNQRTVERWLNAGDLKGYKLGKGRTALWRIPEESLSGFLKKYENKKGRKK